MRAQLITIDSASFTPSNSDPKITDEIVEEINNNITVNKIIHTNNIMYGDIVRFEYFLCIDEEYDLIYDGTDLKRLLYHEGEYIIPSEFEMFFTFPLDYYIDIFGPDTSFYIKFKNINISEIKWTRYGKGKLNYWYDLRKLKIYIEYEHPEDYLEDHDLNKLKQSFEKGIFNTYCERENHGQAPNILYLLVN